jgi:hypothetical protein
MPYVDPKMLDKKITYKPNEKCDIYCLGVLFWELTIRSSPFNTLEDNHITPGEPVPDTNEKFIVLYQRMCKLMSEQ